MIPTVIDTVARVTKGSPLTAAEMDANIANLKTAVLALSGVWLEGRVVFAEPVAGERDNVVWIKLTGDVGPYWWNADTGKWVRVVHEGLFAATAGTSTAYTATVTWAIEALSEIQGRIITLVPNLANTGAATLALNSLSAVAIKKGSADVVAGDIALGVPMAVVYDGSYFQLLNPKTVSWDDVSDKPTTLIYATVDAFAIPVFAESGTPISKSIPEALSGGTILGFRPVLVLDDTETDAGYVDSDEVEVSTFFADTGSGDGIASCPWAFSVNATSITIVPYYRAGGVFALSKTNGAPTGITYSKWNMKIYLVGIPAA